MQYNVIEHRRMNSMRIASVKREGFRQLINSVLMYLRVSIVILINFIAATTLHLNTPLE